MASSSRKFFLYLFLSTFLHFSVLLFFVVAPSDGVKVGSPTVTVDVIPAPPPAAPIAKARPLVASRPRPVEKAPEPEKEQKPAPTAAASPVPVAASPSSSASAVSASGQASLLSAYVYKIVELLNRSKVYPQEAIDREQEGKVVVAVTLASDGQVKEAKVIEASLYDVLNKAALRTVLRIAKFPPPPQAAGDFRFTAPLQYRIERR